MLDRIIQDIRNIQQEVSSLAPSRELASAKTKLDEACHWLRDHIEMTEEKVQEILK